MTLTEATATIAIAFNRMLAEGEDNQSAKKWLQNDAERAADAWLIEGVEKSILTYDELYEALVKAGVESDEAERLVEGYFWHAPVDE
jgi:hypothetical protein